MSADDRRWMQRALELAALGRGGTSPNPMVGAVIVRDGVVLGEGWHRRAGEPHAEPNALKDAGDVRGATMVVTLEPCCHRNKRTPPCTDALIASGIGRVVVAALDPNPAVAGRGVDTLRAAGIAVETGLMRAEAEALNVVFHHWITTKTPYVRLKLAQSLDGRIARAPGVRHWVTGEAMRAHVHRMRADVDAVMVGRGTVVVDDPLLTVRGVAGDWKEPLRVVVDSQLSIAPDAKVYAGPGAVVVTREGAGARAEALRAHGVAVVEARGVAGVDLRAMLSALAAMNVTSILVEGGGTLAASLLTEDLVDELVLHVAPVVYGAHGVPSVGVLANERRFTIVASTRYGDDLELILRRA